MKPGKYLLSILLSIFFAHTTFAETTVTLPSSFELMGSNVVITKGGMSKIMVKYNSLTRSQKHYDILLERCNTYFPYIARELQTRGVPEEFKFLALQESLLDGNAISNAKPPAVGFWQFKDFTAKERGMVINRNIDERKNVVAASIGAADYLSKNHYYLGNWFYAMISYHDGLGGAKKYIKQNRLNYYSNVTITDKTHPYVIHYLAHYFAFKDQVGKDKNHTVLIELPTNGYSLSQVSKFTGQPLTILSNNNIWLSGSYIPEDKVYSVMIEAKPNEINQMVAKLSPYAKTRKTRAPRAMFQFYADSIKDDYPFVVFKATEKEDQKYEFARINGVDAVIIKKEMTQKELVSALGKETISKGKLKKYNYIKGKDTLIKDRHYYISPLPSSIPVSYHIMQQDETLDYIAIKYGIDLKALMKINDVSNDDEVKVGDKIYFN